MKTVIKVETQDKVISLGRCGKRSAQELLHKRKEAPLYRKLQGLMAEYYPNDKIDAIELNGAVQGEIRFLT